MPRGGGLTPDRRDKVDALRDRLESLEHTVENRDVDVSRRGAMAVGTAFRHMTEAFRAQPET